MTQPVPLDKLVCVAPDKVTTIWPHVESFVQSAFLSGRGDDTPDVVKSDLDAGRALLWVVWDGAGILAVATTKIVQTPTKKLCIVTSCAGREMPRWIGFINDLAAYAKQAGCAALRVEGREGWVKMLPEFRQPFVVLERAL